MALPLKVRSQVFGVLDVQSTKAAAFTEEDIEVLQVLADQVALAIDNSRAHAESEAIIHELNALYNQQISNSWQQRLERGDLVYSYRSGKVVKEGFPSPINDPQVTDERLLNIPLIMRGQSLGKITLRRHPDSPPWSKEESDMSTQIVNQIVLSLENAQLVEENRLRAQNEALISQITGKTQGLLDVETVIKTAAQEIGRSLGLAKIQIRLEDERFDISPSNQAIETLSPEIKS